MSGTTNSLYLLVPFYIHRLSENDLNASAISWSWGKAVHSQAPLPAQPGITATIFWLYIISFKWNQPEDRGSIFLCNDRIEHTAVREPKTQSVCGQLINMAAFNVQYSHPCSLSSTMPWSHMVAVAVQVHTFILALDRQEWLPSCLSHFTTSTTWTWSWVHLRGSLDVVGTRKISRTARIWTIIPWSASPHASCYNDWPIPVPFSPFVIQCIAQPFMNSK